MKSSKCRPTPFQGMTFWLGLRVSVAVVSLSLFVIIILILPNILQISINWIKTAFKMFLGWIKSFFSTNTSSIEVVKKNEVSQHSSIETSQKRLGNF